jgi:DNA-binding helix-hairpin-helix protein with protein kinase domain
MNQLLKRNAVALGQSSGRSYAVAGYLGSGGQGEVYQATSGAEHYAVKWYYRNMATAEQRRILDDLVRRGAPDSRFLWPIEIVTSPHAPGYGYVMPLRDKRFRSVHDLLAGKASPSYMALCSAAYNLVDAFLQLHTNGLSYRDINDGGVLFDYANGDVVVCDNDNVYVNGLGDAGVKGKMRWMAPEIVRGEAGPSTDTDLYSLAVLLFFMFVAHHPLEGQLESSIRSLDMKAMNHLYGTDPVFIFDPVDQRNRPVREFHRNAIDLWPNYPRFLQRLFVRSFTDGLKDPQNGRVRENEWRKALSKARDSLYLCEACKAEQFFDAEVKNSDRVCTECRRQPGIPLRMRIDQSDVVVVVAEQRRLFEHHLLRRSDYKFDTCLAEVVKKPSQPAVLGLRNLSQDVWIATAPTGQESYVQPGQSVSLVPGGQINFGQTLGIVRQ